MASTKLRLGSLVGWVGMGLLLGGCGASGDGKAADEQTGGGVVSELRSAEARVTPAASEADVAAQGEREFAFTFMHALKSDENLAFSPHSLSAAFAMLTDAAEGQTLSEVEQTLHFAAANEAFHRSQDALSLGLAARNRDALSTDSEQVDAQILSESNDIWMRDDSPPEQSYLDTLARYYGVGVHHADFGKQPGAARVAINAKISTDTHELIPELIPDGAIDASTVAVLTNALYFKAPWRASFADPTPGDFHALDGSTKTASMLRQQTRLPYFTGEGFVSVAVPYYGDELELLLVVPDAGKYDDVRSALSGDLLAQIVSGRELEPTSLTLPKFDVKSTVPATKTFKQLGMLTPFDPGAARFPKLTSPLFDNVYVSDVLHQATVAIDEKGTEASAATAILLAGTSAAVDPPQPKQVTIDRPFLFVIRDNPTGSVLFAGQIVTP